jgi:hypothetical protein
VRNLLVISLLLVLGLNGFGQEPQLTKDFIKDKDGDLGLREKYLKKAILDSGNSRDEFNGVAYFNYFIGKTKEEIIKLLGPPNQTISVITKKRNGNRPSNIKVDKIVYYISHSDSKCDGGSIYEFPTIPIKPEEIVEGKIKSVFLEFNYDCEDKIKKNRKDQFIKLNFSFYLDDER